MTDGGNESPVEQFLAEYFDDGVAGDGLEADERAVIDSILAYVDGRFSGMKYILGLALDFVLLAQRLYRECGADMLAAFRPDYPTDELFSDFRLVEKRGTRKANTLSLVFGDSDKPCTQGIRQLEESVLAFFTGMGRTGYPSAYVYNTGQWHKYRDLLTQAFKLSQAGRYACCQAILNYGLERFDSAFPVGREIPRHRLFEDVLGDYPREDPDENGGLAFQGICFGYLKADRPHLTLVALGVRGGSRRVQRFGDIDGYYGLDLELSAEVKDIDITGENLERQLNEFLTAVKETRTSGIAMVRSISDEARGRLSELSAGRVSALTLSEMATQVRLWDWPKQDAALAAFAHFLAHVEMNPLAVSRLVAFLAERDPTHALPQFQPQLAPGPAAETQDAP